VFYVGSAGKFESEPLLKINKKIFKGNKTKYTSIKRKKNTIPMMRLILIAKCN
jgi:hypothetical protein